MVNTEFELTDTTNPSLDSESSVDGSSSGNRVDIVPSDNSTVAQGIMDSVSAERNVSDVNNNRTDVDSNEFSDRNHGSSSVKHVKSEQQKKESKSKESVSPVYDSMISMFDDFAANGNATDVVKPQSTMEVSHGHGFEVGDMVWGKVKSHPWWPGHVYSEEFATPSVRRSKREGLLLVAFFGDSSYGWFDPSELVPFDSHFAEKSRQTNSKTFVKAVEEAMDEVSRRSALGLSCMCRSKQNFRETGVQGYFAVDVADYEPGAVYSSDAIEKARDSFQPSLALDFIRQLALEPMGNEHPGIDFIKNKAKVISYRRAVYEEFDETYAQAFGHQPDRSSPGSVQELPPGRTPTKGRSLASCHMKFGAIGCFELHALFLYHEFLAQSCFMFGVENCLENKGIDISIFKIKVGLSLKRLKDTWCGPYFTVSVLSGMKYWIITAPLSGRQVFADTSGKGKSSSAKPNKPKDHAKKDKYLFKRRDEPKEVKVLKKEKKKLSFSPLPVKDSMANASSGGDYVLQKRDLGTHEQAGTAIASGELASKNATPTGASLEDAAPIVLEFNDPNVKMITSKVESPEIAPGFGGNLPTVKISGDDEKKIVPEKTGSDLVDDTRSSGPTDKVVASQRADNGPKKVKKASKRPAGELGSGKSVLPEKKKKRKKQALMADGTHDVLRKDGVSLADKVSAKKPVQSAPIEDPNGTDSKTTTASSTSQEMNHDVELSRVFLRFRSSVFQKSLNVAEDEGNDTHSSTKSSTENGLPAKQQSRPDDPTKGGRKRGPSDRQEEIAAKKKKKVGDIKNLTKEKKVIKKTDEPASLGDVKQASAVTAPRKSESRNIEQRAPEPTMLVMKFPPGGSLPSINELKARFARYGPMDHSTTRVFWNTSTCRVVYRHKAHAQAAYKFVVGSSSLFGNTDIKCSLKEVSGDYEAPPAVKVPREEGSVEAMAAGLQLKSCLKKSSGGDEAAGGGSGKGMPRVKFMLGGEESVKNKNGSSSSSFSSSHATMDFNSKNFQKGVLPLPISSSTTIPIATSTAQITRPLPPPPPTSLHHGGVGLLPTPRLNFSGDIKQTQPPPPPPGKFVHNLQRPQLPPPPPPPPQPQPQPQPKVDITQQMLSLLTKCNDVVTNVTNMLGYVPYHPL
ncbi:hypothetical protein OSB04_011612 [Centaurea solstitialis]|uniref:PWWP domain-containing protein n=1 Tax=Centaurea solstitialis TaxID=347529 RepID=A0AA38THB7_9ASTR|nr:hypothetical protein OSB04_011612 [Centaurea solstitialis]